MPKKTKSTPADAFAKLTWDELEEWAGNRIVRRGRTYGHQGAVKDLARTSGGTLVAWVRGERRYATKVEIDAKGKLHSACTCPCLDTCKHAVAVVLVYLDEVKNDRVVPLATDDDLRLADIAAMEKRVERLADLDGDDDGDDLEDDVNEDGDKDEGEEAKISPRPRRRRASAWRALLDGMTRDQLVGLVEELASFDEVRSHLEHRTALLSGREGALLKKIRLAIRDLHEPEWDGNWGHPSVDLGQLEEQLAALLKKGHADELVRLGPDLLSGAGKTVETEHESESAYELGRCLAIVFRALRRSSLPPDEQIDVAVQMELADEYSLCGDAPRKILDGKHSKDVWRAAATRLQDRLQQLERPTDKDHFGARHRRDRLVDYLVHALQESGQKDESIPLCEREAPLTKNYCRLVDRLVAAGRVEEAERWCARGMEDVGNLRGLAADLRGRLEQIARKHGEPLRAVALKADVFFEEPGLESFQHLIKAARAEGAGPAVEAWARHFLVTGQRPMPAGTKARSTKGDPARPWPLPESGVPARPSRRQVETPLTDVLIQIAIAEKDPDEVLRWYDVQCSRRRGWVGPDLQVAQAIEAKHPNRAITIYKKQAEVEINRVTPRGYEQGASLLRHVKRVLLKSDRKDEWEIYLAEVRERNRGRPRCIEELDRLERGSRRIAARRMRA